MKRLSGCLMVLFVALMMTGVASAGDGVVVLPHAAKKFATLPASSPGSPEGIAADASGNIYVSTFSFGDPAFIHVFSPQGRLIDTIPVPAGVATVAALLGLAFDQNGDLFAADFANGTAFNGRILKISPPDSSGIVTEFVPPGTLTAPNALTFNSAGELFVSDSFQGSIYKISSGGAVSSFISGDPQLQTGGFPPFGANGLDFNEDESALFVANTGDDRILRIGVNMDGSAGAISTFAESINGADGIAFDKKGHLWVVGNQADQVVALNESGRVVAELGEFLGIRRDGSARGLIFPASLVIVKNQIFVTNLALPLPGATEPEVDVTTYTVSRINMPKL